MITLNNSNINFDSEDTSDESKYTISLSYKSSNFIFKTAGIERLKIMNNGNVGIGEFNTPEAPLPSSKLHICDNNAKIIIQDTRIVTYGDIYATRLNQELLPIEIGTDKIEKYIKFTYVGNDLGSARQSQYVITTTTELEVDILIVGGGGAGGDAYGGGGGAGGVVYVKNHKLLPGRYQVRVGNGGVGLSSSFLDDVLGTGGTIFSNQNGSDSEIRILQETPTTYTIGDITMLAKGGGTGGTNSVSDAGDNSASSEVGRSGGSSGGSSGSGSEIDKDGYVRYDSGVPTQGNTYWNGSSYVVGGNQGRQNLSTTDPNRFTFIVGGGGGGIGSQGNNSTCGNNGVGIDITGVTQFYAAGGGAGIHTKSGYTIVDLESYGLGGSGGIGGNGRIYKYNVATSTYIRSASSGKADTGSGGGGSAYQIAGLPEENAGSGGSGVVIIRYRPLRSTSASIELIRNTYSSNDNNTDYKIGNFDGGFKIVSSTSNIDIDRLVVDKNGDITISRSINASNYLLNGQPFSILGEAKNSSNYISSTSNLLIEYINRKNQLNTSSQWIDSENSIDIYYDKGKVGIGTTYPTNNLHIYNTKSSITNLKIQSDMDLAATNLLPPDFQIYKHDTTKLLNRGEDIQVSKHSGTNGYDRLYKGYEFVISGTGTNLIQYFVIETSQEYIVDILIVGAGGTSSKYSATVGVGGGAGGAGGIVYIVDKKLDAGKYYITVGNFVDNDSVRKGEDSSIRYYSNGTIGEIVTIDNINLVGKGGGRGRTDTDDDTIVRGIGSGGGGYYKASTNPALLSGITQDQGNTYWNGTTYTAGGFDGKNANADNNIGGDGGGIITSVGSGISIPLFAGQMGGKFSPVIGMGGKVYSTAQTDIIRNGEANTGAGGSRDYANYGKGGSGYVYIKYRKIPQSESSINLSIGSTKQLSYNISNSNNIFKINSGTSDVMVINSDGNATLKGTLTAKSYLIEGGTNIIKDVIRDTSNYIASTSNILIKHILTTSNLITNFINNKKSSQWNDRISVPAVALVDIYYEGNVGIGVTAGTGVYNPGPISKLTINDYISSFNHSDAPLTITNQTVPSRIDPIDVLHLCRVGAASGAYNTGMRATFRLGKSEALTTKSKTRLDIGLSDGAYNTSNIIMTIRSDGKVGIGITNPTTELHVAGTITTTNLITTSITTSNLTVESFSGNINVSTSIGTLSVAHGGTGAPASSITNGRLLFMGVGTDSSTQIIKSTELFYNSTFTKLGVGTMPDEKSSKLNINENIKSTPTFDYSISPLTITNKTYDNINTPTDVLHLCRVGNVIDEDIEPVGIRATFKLSKWSPSSPSLQTDISKSNTRLDLELADSSYNTANGVMTILSSGKIGIGSIASPNSDPYNSINYKSSILNINNNISEANHLDSYNYSESPLTITSEIFLPLATPINDMKDILHLCRRGLNLTNPLTNPNGIRASFRLGIWEQSSGNSRTRLDIALANGAYKEASSSVMTIQSDSKVGIGKTNPGVALDVVGSIKASANLEISGNVGIGTTSHATYKLDVNGNINMPSGGILSAGGLAYKPATAGLSDTANAIASTSTSIVSVANGGTGLNTLTSGHLLYASSGTAIGQPTNLFWDSSKLAIGTTTLNTNCSTLTINEIVSSFNHSVAPLTITNITVPSIIDPIDVLHLCRTGAASGVYNTGMRATFRLGKYDAVAGTSKTRLDIGLSDGAYNTSNIVMTIRSDGKVGIGKTNPTTALDVNGGINIPTGSTYNINGTVYKPATATLADKATKLATAVNIAGVSFDGSGAISIPYGNLTGLQAALDAKQGTLAGSTIDGNITISGDMTAGAILGGNIYIRNSSPTLFLQDTDNRSGMIHMNSSSMYFLNGAGIDSRNWEPQNGQTWAMRLNMNNNNAIFGGNITASTINSDGSFVAGSYILSYDAVYARSTYDAKIRSDGTGAYLEMGNIGDNNFLRFGSWNNQNTLYCAADRRLQFQINVKTWEFNTDGTCWNGLNSTAWQQASDHRIKKDIKKANLQTCYDNVKNINLYRFKYIDGFKEGTKHDKTQLGYIAQQVKQHFPKSVVRSKTRIDDKREIPDLASVDVSQVNFTLFGAVKQLMKVVEKQSKRIKKLEEMLNIIDDDEVDNDADEPYERIVCDEVDIDDIEPSEPEGV